MKQNRSNMRQNTVRVSFDIPIQEHILLKTECAQARIAIKDFLHKWMLKGMQELKEKKLQEELKEAIQESREGATKYIDASRFAEFADE